MVKKKTGDNYPTDLKGQMLYVGSIVVVPCFENGPDEIKMIVLKLGYVVKLTQKRGIDVMVFLGESEKKGEYVTSIDRIQRGDQVCIISVESLKLRDPLHEAVRFGAAMARNDE